MTSRRTTRREPTREPAPPPARVRNRLALGHAALPAILIVLVAVAVLITYWPVLSCKALSFDDQQYLAENYLVQKPGWTSASRFLREVLEPSTVGGYYQPLAMISLMLDYAQAGRVDNLRPFHRTSLALHIMNTSLVIVLLYLLFRARPRTSGGSSVEEPNGGKNAPPASNGPIWAAAMIGLLFGLHPLTVEPIPWVGERKTLLAAFFALWCLICYVGYARRRSRALYAACLAAYVLALMSKPTSTPLPVLMLLLDFWPLRRLSLRAVIEKAPLFLVGITSAVITIISQARTASVEMPGEHPPMRIPLVLCHNIVFYLYKIICPVNLTSHYPFPDPLRLSDPMILAGVVGTCILIPALLLALRWTRAPLTGWLFFFVAIFPTMGVIGFTNVIASDKYAYLPAVGLLMVLAWLVGKAWSATLSPPMPRVMKAGLLSLVAVLAVAEATATRRYLKHWQSTDRLYNHMIALAPQAPSPHFGLGHFLASQGRFNDAVLEFREAIRLRPRQAEAQTNLGGSLLELGRTDEAMEHLLEAHRLNPSLFAVQNNLAQGLAAQGRYDEAIEHLNEAIRIRPESPRGHYNLANALAKRGRSVEALAHFETAVRIKPDYAEARCGMADTLAALGRGKEAAECYLQALRIRPAYAEAHNRFGKLLADYGRTNEAVDHYREAIRLTPAFAGAHDNLGNALTDLGRSDEALAEYREALRLAPNSAGTLNNLGLALAQRGELEQAINAMSEALRLNPQYAKAHSNLATVLLRQGRIDQAVDHCNQALAIEPNMLAAQVTLGNALRRQGKTDEALAVFQNAARAHPRDANAHFILGAALDDLGRLPEAIEQYQQVLQLDPRHAGAQQRLAAAMARQRG